MSEEKKIGISNSDRAHVLVQAMPYIKRWAGETIVVKYGGNAMINPELKEAVMNDIVLMQLVGVNVVLVHGGGPEISGMLKKIGKESRFVGGMRYTDAETMDIVQQVLAGKVNKDLVQLLENTGGKAVGLCGKGVEKVSVVPDVQLKIAVLKRDKRDLYLRDMPGCLFEERRAGFCCSHRNKVPLPWCRLPPVAKGCDAAGHGRELPAAAVHRQ